MMARTFSICALVCLIVTVSSTARADQCEWLTEEQALAATEYLLFTVGPNAQIAELCEPCGDTMALAYEAGSVSTLEVGDGYFSVVINNQPVDLAYTFVQDMEDGSYSNLAMIVGCPCSDVSACLDAQLQPSDACNPDEEEAESFTFVVDITAATDAPEEPVVIDEAGNGMIFDVIEGQDIVVRLPSNPSTGFDWQVTMTDRTFGYPISTDFEVDSERMGAGGVTVMTWSTQSVLSMVGSHTVVLEYMRAFDDGCDDNSMCAAGQVCLDGVCQSTCDEDTACPAGEVCVDYLCQADPYGSADVFDGTDDAVEAGGCSMAGGSAGANGSLFFVLGLALIVARRRLGL